MADHFTSFSCHLDVGSPEHVQAAMALYVQMAADLEVDDDLAIGFACEAAFGKPSTLWLRDDGGHGEPEYVIAFALRCAEMFGLTGRWGFAWAFTCSAHRLGGFGGGAQILDLDRRRRLAWIDCSQWVTGQLDRSAEVSS